MKAIGLDIGTTTISAAVVEVKEQRVLKAYTIDNGSFLNCEHTWRKIQNPAVITEKAQDLLNQILADFDDIQWIGLTGQMHGILYVDKNGQHVSPLYTWQDGSGEQKCFDNESVCSLVEKKYHLKTYTGYGLVTHLYQMWINQIPENAAKLCTIADYLGMVLTERKAPYIHSSNAASMGFFCVEQSEFMKDILTELGVDCQVLPKVTDTYEQIGTYRQIPVITAIGDNQASFLGSVKDPEASVLVNMGTGGQVSVLSDVICQAEGVEVRPYNKGRYLLAGSSLCGGRAYAILENFFRSYTETAGLTGADHYQIMSSILDKEDFGKREDQLEICTNFSGTRENPSLRGSITNIGISNFTPGAFIYGVLDGMAEELHRMYQGIDKDILQQKTMLVASGNGVRKNVHLQRIFEEKFGMPLQLAENKEEASCGAALTGVSALNL